MNRIVLQNMLPVVFSEIQDLHSDIWNKEVVFEKKKSYLIKAVSGTGKSSLCSYIYGYRADFSGSLLFDQAELRKLNPKNWDAIRNRELSLLFQELRLFPELTAWENVCLKNQLTDFKTHAEIKELFEQLGVWEQKNQLIGKMSWGQQQRVAIIRSLCQPFDFILLDEPVSHLDDENARIIARLIEQEITCREAGLIVTSIGKDLPMEYTQTWML